LLCQALKVWISRNTGENLPNTKVKRAKTEVKGLKKDIKSLQKETDEIVNDVFELSETLAGLAGYKQHFNSYINTLNTLKAEAKELRQGEELDFDAADYFKDLVNQEATAKQKQRQVPARGNSKQPQQVTIKSRVDTLKRSVDAFNNALNNNGRNQPQQPQRGARGGIGRRGGAQGNPVRPVSIDATRNALNQAIDDFKNDLEKQRENVCTQSTFGDFFYGGSTMRNVVTMGVLALGALYMCDSVKNTATGQKISQMANTGSTMVKQALNKAFTWIMAKLA
jgi:uncharacterized phage infection (PIP) family protein YhgE